MYNNGGLDYLAVKIFFNFIIPVGHSITRDHWIYFAYEGTVIVIAYESIQPRKVVLPARYLRIVPKYKQATLDRLGIEMAELAEEVFLGIDKALQV